MSDSLWRYSSARLLTSFSWLWWASFWVTLARYWLAEIRLCWPWMEALAVQTVTRWMDEAALASLLSVQEVWHLLQLTAFQKDEPLVKDARGRWLGFGAEPVFPWICPAQSGLSSFAEAAETNWLLIGQRLASKWKILFRKWQACSKRERERAREIEKTSCVTLGGHGGLIVLH